MEFQKLAKGIVASFPLSSMQQGLLLHSLDPHNRGVYIQQRVCALNEIVDVPLLCKAWRQLIRRHAVLRTSFRWTAEGELKQDVHAEIELPFTSDDWSNLTSEIQQQRLNFFLSSDRDLGFDVTDSPLLRLKLFKLGDSDYRMVWTFHHSLLDGRSHLHLLIELFNSYDAFCEGRELELEPTRPYHEYIEWLAGQDWSNAEAFWRRSLSAFAKATSLRLALTAQAPATEQHASQHASIERRLPETLTAQLRARARQDDVTLNNLLQASWSLLLSRYSGEQEVLFGATRSCRHWTSDGGESMIGLFINTLPFRVRVRREQEVSTWLKELRAQQVALRDYEHTPLIKIKEWSDVPGGQPLFDSLLIFEDYQAPKRLRALGGKWSRREFKLLEQNNYPLLFAAYADDDLLLKLEYDPQQFDRDAMTRLLEQLETVLKDLAQNQAQRVGELTWLPASEYQLLRGEVPVSTVPGRTVAELFEEQVERAPEAVAVVFADERVTYRELNKRANQLASYLRQNGVGPEVLVGVCLERSTDLVVALLAVMKAGGAYVPLDPVFPKERLSFMINDSRVPVLLTQQDLLTELPASEIRVVSLDGERETINLENNANLSVQIEPENLAYVIYTSGSTGQPKGVQIDQRALTNLITWAQARVGLIADDVLVAETTISFDIAALEIFLPLSIGARVVLATRQVATDASALAALIEECSASVFQATPSGWRALLDVGWQGKPNLRAFCGGEALPRELAHRLRQNCGSLWNMYGPTETTIYSAVGPVEEGDGLVSIGEPIANTGLLVLDRDLSLTPLSVPGELHIGGAGLARGYWGRPDLTAEKFVPNPYSMTPGERMYKTGDLVRIVPREGIVYLGRLDNQVKLRGFRIELGEIETALRAHPEIEESVVMMREDTAGDPRLVAYVINRGPQQPADLREFLQIRLPEYMIPAAFVSMDVFPQTPNGKLDRRALPAPDYGVRSKTHYVAPRTAIEGGLAEIWETCLQVRPIGIHDNFFDLGGHSLLANRVITRVFDVFQVRLSLRYFFERPTISGLSEFLARADTNAPASPPIRRLPRP